jgi:hypothetical protein
MNQRIKVMNLKTGKVSSLKKFKANSLIEFNKTHLSFSEIVERRLLSKGELERLVVSGTLKECKYRNKRYIERVELFNFFGKK